MRDRDDFSTPVGIAFLRNYVKSGAKLDNEQARALLAALEAAEAERARIEALHKPTKIDVYEGDCIEQDCDHEGECPEVEISVCSHCLALADLYEPERYPNEIRWPCPTTRALAEQSKETK